MGILMVHLLLLHVYNSSSIHGVVGGVFSLHFIWKDFITIVVILLSCCLLVSIVPVQFMEADN
jgi:quinol-cytochrome oxidoreductase complex cytochrome b subunit